MDEEKDNGLIRFLLVAFPAGLILIGGLVVASTHLLGDRASRDPNELVRLQAASLNRRPVNEADLRSYLSTLSEIGERHAARPEALSTASYWIASTLGGANTGYALDVQTFEWEGGELRNLVAELPGRSRRSEIVVFGAAYDAGPPAETGTSGHGEAAAVLLAVARSLAGDTQGRSVRFVAYAAGNASGEGGAAAPLPPARERYALRARGRGDGVVTVLSVGAGSASGSASAVPFRGNEAARFLVERAAGAFRQGSGLEVEVVLPEPAGSPPTAGGAEEAERSDLEPGGEWGGRVPVIEVTGLPIATGIEGAADDFGRLEAFAKGMEAAVRALATP